MTEAELLRQQIKTKTGRDFTQFSIKGILQNPVCLIADQDAYQYHDQGKQIREKRMSLNMTQREYADILGVSLCNLKKQGKEHSLFALLFDWSLSLFSLAPIKNRLRDRVDQFQLLCRGTVQFLDVLRHIFGVEFSNMRVKQRLFSGCLWVMDDDFDKQVPPLQALFKCMGILVSKCSVAWKNQWVDKS